MDALLKAAQYLHRTIDNPRNHHMDDIIAIQLSDTVKARIVDKELSNHYVQRGNRRKVRSQLAIYDYIKKLEQPESLDVMVTQLFIDDAGFHRITQLNSNNVEYALPDVGIENRHCHFDTG